MLPTAFFSSKSNVPRLPTGGGNVSGRMLYSNKTNVELSLILIMECNVRPKFKSAPGDAEEDRVIDILFPNRFTTLDEEVDLKTADNRKNRNFAYFLWQILAFFRVNVLFLYHFLTLYL